MPKKFPMEELCDLMTAEAEQQRAARKTITKSVVYDTMYASDPAMLMRKIQNKQYEEISSNARVVGIDIVSVMADGDGYRAFYKMHIERTEPFLKS